ncbi:MAG: DJ-1/PfpI family protein [Longicatena sp.]|uniref:DJ-1 family glyoxalase III n=1 Tax=Anaerorhabdus sp. TaxID=1872524 RepID=UPI002FC8B6F5
MQSKLEIEYKVLLTEEEFNLLLDSYPNHELISQTNYYFDTTPSLKERRMGCRIRKIDNKFIFTLKIKQSNGHQEIEFPISRFDINEPLIQECFVKYDIVNPRCVGELHTYRHLVQLSHAELCIDKNEYNGITDYEVEYELKDSTINTFDEFMSILDNAHITYQPNKRTKIQRCLETRRYPMKTAIFCANGFEECEALLVVDLLRRANMEIDIISMNDTLEVKSSHNVTITADDCFIDTNFHEYDVLVLPGGMPGTKNLQDNERLKTIIKKHNEQNKLICAICAAPSILGQLGLLQNKNATCFPTFKDKCIGANLIDDTVVQDGNIITGVGLGAAIEFACKIIENCIGKEEADKILTQIQMEKICD